MARDVLFFVHMLVALPIWHDRVSPVLDVARRLLLVEVGAGQCDLAGDVVLGAGSLTARVESLTEAGVEKVVCGAVSKSLETMLAANGVEVVSGVCADVDRLLEALRVGRLDSPELLMPGCRCRSSLAGRSGCGRRLRYRGGQCEESK